MAVLVSLILFSKRRWFVLRLIHFFDILGVTLLFLSKLMLFELL